MLSVSWANMATGGIPSPANCSSLPKRFMISSVLCGRGTNKAAPGVYRNATERRTLRHDDQGAGSGRVADLSTEFRRPATLAGGLDDEFNAAF